MICNKGYKTQYRTLDVTIKLA